MRASAARVVDSSGPVRPRLPACAPNRRTPRCRALFSRRKCASGSRNSDRMRMRPRVRAVQELLVQVRDGTPLAMRCCWVQVIPCCSSSSTFFFNSRTVLSSSGSLGKAVTARSHSLAAKAGEPEIARALGHVAANAALRVDHGVVVNREVPARPHLPGQQHVALQHRAAGQARLRADDVVLAHHAGVAHLHQAVDLGAALDARLAHRGAVDRGERSASPRRLRSR